MPNGLRTSYVNTVVCSSANAEVRYDGDDFTKRKQSIDKILVFETYRWLMVMAAMLVCLAHGSNDVANAIAPLIVVAGAYDRNERVPYYMGAAGIAAGLIVLGYKVMETVGKKVVKLDYPKGFCAQFSTAVCVICGSILKIPLSTTHCMVGALFGIIIANKMEFVKRAYGITESEDRGGKVETGTHTHSHVTSRKSSIQTEDELDGSNAKLLRKVKEF